MNDEFYFFTAQKNVCDMFIQYCDNNESYYLTLFISISIIIVRFTT